MDGQEGQESRIELVALDRMTPLPVVAPMIAVRRHGRVYITVNALTCITVGLAAQALAKSASPLAGIMHMQVKDLIPLEVDAGVCLAAMYYMMIDQLKLRPRGKAQILFSCFGLFSALPMFTGTYLGMREGYKQSVPVSFSTALFMYLTRLLVCNHSAACLDQNIKKIKTALIEGGVKEKCAVGGAVVIAAAFSFASTNTAYLAPSIVFSLLDAAAAPGFFYTAGILGGLGIFPLALFVAYNGAVAIRQPEVPLAVKAATLIIGTPGCLIGIGGTIAGSAPISEGVLGMSHLTNVVFSSIASLALNALTTSATMVKPIKFLADTFVTPLFSTLCCRRKKREAPSQLDPDNK